MSHIARGLLYAYTYIKFIFSCLQIVRCDGEVLVPYQSQLLEVLQLTLHLKCVQGYELAGQLMRHILRALTLYYPLDYRSIADSFDRPVSEYLAINVGYIVTEMYIVHKVTER